MNFKKLKQINDEIQINDAIISNTPILRMGDLNGGLGQNYIKGDDHQTTPNVELIIGIIEKYSLMLGNKFIYMLRVVDLIWKKL